MGAKPHKDRSAKNTTVKSNPLYQQSDIVVNPKPKNPAPTPSTPKPTPTSSMRVVPLLHPYVYEDAPYRPNVLAVMARPEVREKESERVKRQHHGDTSGEACLDSNLLRVPPEILRDIILQFRERARNSTQAYQWRRALLDFMGTCTAINARARTLYQFRTLDYLAPLSGVYRCDMWTNVTMYSRPYDAFAFNFLLELDIPENKIKGKLKVAVTEGTDTAVTLKPSHFQFVPVFGRQLSKELRYFPSESFYKFGLNYPYTEQDKLVEGVGMWRVTGILLKLFVSTHDWNLLSELTRNGLLARETALADKFRLCNQQTNICDDEARCVFSQIFTLKQKVVDSIYGLSAMPVRKPRENSSSSSYTSSYSEDSCSYSLDDVTLPNVEDLKMRTRGIMYEGFFSHKVTREHVLAAMGAEDGAMPRNPEAKKKCEGRMAGKVNEPTLKFYDYSQVRRCGVLPQDAADDVAAEGNDADECCQHEVQRLVDDICVRADPDMKRELVSVVSKECMVAPGMTDGEISTRVLELWNEMLAV